ncbi:outer membrane protein [Mesorhizobium shangrilense]|uniref:Outer membrane protein n=1 Tax=Mesorhizobium shangrilense TaxID=460060 RepID=A0ABV2D888_9HYPH
MKPTLLAAAVLAALTSTGAMAADVVASEPAPVAATYNWSGFYAGANIGGGWSHVDWAFLPSLNPANHSGSGVLGGLQIGYNFQNNNIVYGIEADISAADIHGGTACPNPTFSCDSKVSMLGSVRGRLGWTADRLLVYGTGGLGYGTVDISDVNSSGTVFGTKKTRAGWTAGAGIEYALDQHWTVKGEYKYFDLGRADYFTDGEFVRAKTQIHTAIIGVNYKF